MCVLFHGVFIVRQKVLDMESLLPYIKCIETPNRKKQMTTITNERIQLHVLGKLTTGTTQVLRRDVAAALQVSAKQVEAAMAACALVTRQTANGGHHVRYGLA